LSPAALFEYSQNGHAFQVCNSCGGKRRSIAARSFPRSPHRRSSGVDRDVYYTTIAQRQGASDAILKLADISRPIVLRKLFIVPASPAHFHRA